MQLLSFNLAKLTDFSAYGASLHLLQRHPVDVILGDHVECVVRGECGGEGAAVVSYNAQTVAVELMHDVLQRADCSLYREGWLYDL